MSSLVLLYHDTPDVATRGRDTALPVFKEQIERLIDAGARFIRFGEALHPEVLKRGMHVAITFDDCHKTNGAAFQFLHDKGIIASAFVVKEWSQTHPDYLSAAAISSLRGICEFGSHSVSHCDLATLPRSRLIDELRASKVYVEQLVERPVDTFSLPGGAASGQVIAAAKGVGYVAIGNSVPLDNRSAGETINRFCISATHDASVPARLVMASAWHWSARRWWTDLRREIVRAVGEDTYTSASVIARANLRRLRRRGRRRMP